MADETQPQTLDSTSSSNPTAAHKKHLAMLDRLSKRSNTTTTTSSSSSSSISTFLSNFSSTKNSIETRISNCRSPNSEDMKSELDSIAAAISDMDRLLAENSYLLPPYEVRASLESISHLKDSLELANAELIPRKRFSFKNKTPKTSNTTPINPPEQEKSNLGNLGNVFSDGPGFRSKKDAILVKDFRVSEQFEGDFTLADLDSCEVSIKGRLRALFVHRLTNCRVFVGPVLGSVHIEDVEGCMFVMASHQIRIHEVRLTDFYLRVRSRPIIEDSSGVRFAPYVLDYEGLDDELRESGLGEETGNWANVDDFKWLRAVQSPNWCLIPEAERSGIIDISEVKEQQAGG